jgi:hypothetical protein
LIVGVGSILHSPRFLAAEGVEERNGRVLNVVHTGASSCFREFELRDHPVSLMLMRRRGDESHAGFTEVPDEELKFISRWKRCRVGEK